MDGCGTAVRGKSPAQALLNHRCDRIPARPWHDEYHIFKHFPPLIRRLPCLLFQELCRPRLTHEEGEVALHRVQSRKPQKHHEAYMRYAPMRQVGQKECYGD
ncbi:hypothetical protein TraAM80_01871 [Trypanosoma rangeli]|uniref:Uncharacterized protein n=1 Tax=Trypanosoma rangeli TaxID=5698 RepID=A0A3R7L9P2_TRYRA|nr:uncharacterized protein TraAM80_01871 [Trypanosoma rangeli]RNF09846.1 hypothetical protein TraAM80_01871 [Trypanosoma rangeli]|eukprot:RNF09846.1 hypothetical protein TraAM80_01871 [Trypanosoma rangeli]